MLELGAVMLLHDLPRITGQYIGWRSAKAWMYFGWWMDSSAMVLA